MPKAHGFGGSDSFLAQGHGKKGLEEILKIDDVPPIRVETGPAALQPFSLVDRGAMVKKEHLRGMEPSTEELAPARKKCFGAPHNAEI